jgi:quercetin dioxygenase-like cupin family protein
MAAIHAERREPAPPDGPLELDRAGDDLQQQAARMASGRAAWTLTPGAHAPLKQTLVALRAGIELSEHEMRNPATIVVLRGRVALRTEQGAVEVHAGQWAEVTDSRHTLGVVDDAVMLVTVALVPEG